MQSSTQLITSSNVPEVTFNPERVELIKKTICHGASDDELKLFLMQCERTGLDPFSRQIYSIERKTKKWNPSTRTESWEIKRTTQISIDGFRLIAQRSGKYAGQKQTEWCAKDGVWKNIWTSQEPPFAARIGVLRKDFTEPLYAIAKWDAYALDGQGHVLSMWKKMPDHMLAKVAESLALRKAFPQELAGLYSSEELPEPTPQTASLIIPEQEAIYEATNEQKKTLVYFINKLDIENKYAETYKWFSDRLLGTKMNDLQTNIDSIYVNYKTEIEDKIVCQE